MDEFVCEFTEENVVRQLRVAELFMEERLINTHSDALLFTCQTYDLPG